MSNSTLISYTKLSPNKNSPRNHKIDTITIHHMAAVNATIEACGAGFAQSSRQASANYGIGSDGRIALYVDEADRSWGSSNGANDHRAVTIEVANSGGDPNWPVSDKAYAALIELCADICRRNGIARLVWASSKSDRVNHKNGANMTVHQDFAATACPGPYLLGRMADIAAQVNARLAVQVEPASAWAQAAWQKAANLGVFDGTNPGEPLTREQAALVLDRLGLLEGGS